MGNEDENFRSLTNYFVCLTRSCCKDESLYLDSIEFAPTKRIKPDYQPLNLKNSSFQCNQNLQQEFDSFFEVPENTFSSNDFSNKKTNMIPESTPIPQNLPKINVSIDSFYTYRLKLFEAFHYLLQEMKINNTTAFMQKKFCYFLFCFSKNLDVPALRSYVDYYIQEFPDIVQEYFADEELRKVEANVEIVHTVHPQEAKITIDKNVVDIFETLNSLIDGESKNTNFKFFFLKSQSIVRIFENYSSLNGRINNSVFCNETLESQISTIFNLYSRKESVSPIMNRASFSSKQTISKIENDIEHYLPQTFFEENMKRLYLAFDSVKNIEILPISIKVVVIDYLLSNFNQIKDLPFKVSRFGYEILGRFDYSMNLQPKGASINLSLGYDLPKIISRIVQCKNESESIILTENEKRKGDLVFQEVNRLLDSVSTMKIKINPQMNIPEDRYQTEGMVILNKLSVRKMSLMVGQGALNFSSVNTYLTDSLNIPKINFTGIILPANLRISLDLKEEKDGVLQWPDFHNGVATGLNLSQTLKNQSSSHLRTWILYQKPDTPTNDHAGLLFAFGLLGFLDCITPPDLYSYMRVSHEMTTVGMLLGLTASRIGKYDDPTFRALCIHIPSLLPKAIDMDFTIPIQTAALTGIGLLHKGTGSKLMTEMALSQIGKKFSDKSPDRDSYSLAAGFSLGLIHLGKGGSKAFLKDLNMDERLIRYIEGGKPMNQPQSYMSTKVNTDAKSSTIKEGSNVNIHITAPPALVALSLMHMKSNNSEIASKITIPNTFAMLENCNPNLILLKILTRNLIMWNNVDCTTEFIFSQIPELVRFIFEKPAKDFFDLYSLSSSDDVDFNTVASVYFNIIGGCVLSIGFKYTGTGNSKAQETIIKEIIRLRKLKVNTCELSNDYLSKNTLSLYSINQLLSVCVLALSLVMAGTCNVKCLKIARVIRKKFQSENQMHFGFNMAIHMAIGFLFLGNGKYTFSNKKFAIAALLMSVYPQFPQSAQDNKYHLQALRHFYVLAIEERSFHAIDIHTKQSISVFVGLNGNNNGELFQENASTPILIQDSKKVTSLKVMDDEYLELELKESLISSKNIFVQRKVIKDSEIARFKGKFLLKRTFE